MEYNGWYYHDRFFKDSNKTSSGEPARPVLSQIPDLGGPQIPQLIIDGGGDNNEKYCKDFLRIKPWDSEYVKLAKQGGVKDLLVIEQNVDPEKSGRDMDNTKKQTSIIDFSRRRATVPKVVNTQPDWYYYHEQTAQPEIAEMSKHKMKEQVIRRAQVSAPSAVDSGLQNRDSNKHSDENKTLPSIFPHRAGMVTQPAYLESINQDIKYTDGIDTTKSGGGHFTRGGNASHAPFAGHDAEAAAGAENVQVWRAGQRISRRRPRQSDLLYFHYNTMPPPHYEKEPINMTKMIAMDYQREWLTHNHTWHKEYHKEREQHNEQTKQRRRARSEHHDATECPSFTSSVSEPLRSGCRLPNETKAGRSARCAKKSVHHKPAPGEHCKKTTVGNNLGSNSDTSAVAKFKISKFKKVPAKIDTNLRITGTRLHGRSTTEKPERLNTETVYNNKNAETGHRKKIMTSSGDIIREMETRTQNNAEIFCTSSKHNRSAQATPIENRADNHQYQSPAPPGGDTRSYSGSPHGVERCLVNGVSSASPVQSQVFGSSSDGPAPSTCRSAVSQHAALTSDNMIIGQSLKPQSATRAQTEVNRTKENSKLFREDGQPVLMRQIPPWEIPPRVSFNIATRQRDTVASRLSIVLEADEHSQSPVDVTS